MPAPIAVVEVQVGVESAQVVSGINKARADVRSGTAGMAADARRGVGAMTAEMGKLGNSVKGIQPAVAGMQQSMMLLGQSAPPQIFGITNALASLAAGGFTPVGIAIAGVSAAIGYFVARTADASEALKRYEQSAEQAAAAARKAGESARSLNVELGLRLARSSVDALDVRIAVLRDSLGEYEFAVREARRQAQDDDAETVRAAQRALAARKREIAELEQERSTRASLAQLERDREAAAARSAEKRSERARQRAADEAAVASATAMAAKADAERDGAALRRMEEISAARAALSRVGRPAEDPIDAEIRSRQSTINTLTRQLREGPGRSATTPESQELRARIEHERELIRILEQRRALEQRLSREAAAAARVDAEGARADTDREAQRAAERAAAEERARAAEDRVRLAQDVGARIKQAQDDLAFELAQGERTETEQRVAEVARRYEALIAEAKQYGLDVVELEEQIAAEQRRIRESAKPGKPDGAPEDQPPAGVDPQVFSVATSAASGLTSALGDIARGSQSAGDAFRDFAIRFTEQIAEMILQATILKAIMGALGFAQTDTGSWVSSSSATTAAHGGTFKVGGVGGLDSQLVAMKVSPGELIRVTNGANSRHGRDGDVQVNLDVRPPAVIADEVMAKSSREARAAVVGKTLARPGKRGWRPGD